MYCISYCFLLFFQLDRDCNLTGLLLQVLNVLFSSFVFVLKSNKIVFALRAFNIHMFDVIFFFFYSSNICYTNTCNNYYTYIHILVYMIYSTKCTLVKFFVSRNRRLTLSYLHYIENVKR